MAYSEKQFEMPCGLEAAIHRLAAACRKDGVEVLSVSVVAGEVDSVLIADLRHSHYLKLLDGEWHEYMKVGDWLGN